MTAAELSDKICNKRHLRQVDITKLIEDYAKQQAVAFGMEITNYSKEDLEQDYLKFINKNNGNNQ